MFPTSTFLCHAPHHHPVLFSGGSTLRPHQGAFGNELSPPQEDAPEVCRAGPRGQRSSPAVRATLLRTEVC